MLETFLTLAILVGLFYFFIYTEDIGTGFIVWWGTQPLMGALDTAAVWVYIVLWIAVLWAWHKNSMKVKFQGVV